MCGSSSQKQLKGTHEVITGIVVPSLGVHQNQLVTFKSSCWSKPQNSHIRISGHETQVRVLRCFQMILVCKDLVDRIPSVFRVKKVELESHFYHFKFGAQFAYILHVHTHIYV